MELHAGLDGSPPLDLQAVARQMGVSPARARRLERQALARLADDQAWIDEARARFAAAIPGPNVRLARLAGDPWWAEIVLVPSALDYFAERVLQVASVLDLDGKLYLAKWGPP